MNAPRVGCWRCANVGPKVNGYRLKFLREIIRWARYLRNVFMYKPIQIVLYHKENQFRYLPSFHMPQNDSNASYNTRINTLRQVLITRATITMGMRLYPLQSNPNTSTCSNCNWAKVNTGVHTRQNLGTGRSFSGYYKSNILYRSVLSVEKEVKHSSRSTIHKHFGCTLLRAK